MQAQLHQDDVADVGENVAKHTRQMTDPNRFGRTDVLATAVLDVLGPHEAIDSGPPHHAQDDHHGGDPIAEHPSHRT